MIHVTATAPVCRHNSDVTFLCVCNKSEIYFAEYVDKHSLYCVCSSHYINTETDIVTYGVTICDIVSSTIHIVKCNIYIVSFTIYKYIVLLTIFV